MLLTSVPPGLLAQYLVVLVAGDVEFNDTTIARLDEALRRGSTVLISERHRDALSERLKALAKRGRLEVLQPWINPATGRPTAIADERLARLARELLPVEILGDPIQFQINRTRTGWVLELVNNRGVAKKPGEPAVIDPQARACVTLKPKLRFTSAREWRSKVVHERAKETLLEIGPGQSEFVEFVTR